MEIKLKYELAGSLLGAILSPVISVIVVLILDIDTLFLGMLAGSVYEKLNDEVEED